MWEFYASNYRVAATFPPIVLIMMLGGLPVKQAAYGHELWEEL
jgi:hypothetical protein